jgi:hypothetical protein
VNANRSRGPDRTTHHRVAFLPAAVLLVAVALTACGRGDADPAAQPTPNVTTFQEGRFDDLPQYPRSEPLGPRADEQGVVARSYKVTGASPEQVMDFYRDALQERWRMLTGVEKLGVGTFRADWVDDDYLLRVSATRESEVDSRDDASENFVTQYSLTLHPL